MHSYPEIKRLTKISGLPVSTIPLRGRLPSCPLSTLRVRIFYPFLLGYRGRNCRNRGPLAAAALGENGVALKDALQRRISTLATAAATAEVRLMIDAEQSWLQPAIDNTVYSLQVIHGRGGMWRRAVRAMVMAPRFLLPRRCQPPGGSIFLNNHVKSRPPTMADLYI